MTVLLANIYLYSCITSNQINTRFSNSLCNLLNSWRHLNLLLLNYNFVFCLSGSFHCLLAKAIRENLDTSRRRICMNPSDHGLNNLWPNFWPQLNAKLCQYIFKWVTKICNLVNFIKCINELFLKFNYSRLSNKLGPAFFVDFISNPFLPQMSVRSLSSTW